MHFNLTDEQRALSEMVQRFLAQQYAFEARRKIRRSPEGWSREIWTKLGEMGLLALQVPEEHGGMAPASVETMLTMSALGRALSVEPFLPSAILGTALIRALGSPAQQEALLPAMATGEPVGPAYAAPLAATYCNMRKASIYGGSNEIQKNIITQMILGL